MCGVGWAKLSCGFWYSWRFAIATTTKIRCWHWDVNLRIAVEWARNERSYFRPLTRHVEKPLLKLPPNIADDLDLRFLLYTINLL